MKRRASSLSLLVVSGVALAAGTSTIPWTELVESDWLMQIAVRKSVVDGKTIYYPAPTKELAAALEQRSEESALRHLAEARRELGDRKGAEAALEAWAAKAGPAAWDEAARWGVQYHDFPFAFRCAEKALKDLPIEARKALATDRIQWAEAHPEAGDKLALSAERARLFPTEPRFTEEWIAALEAGGKLAEAEAALKGATGLPEERRVLVQSNLKLDHGDPAGAYAVLETYLAEPARAPQNATLVAFAKAADDGARGKIDGFRAEVDGRFNARAVLLLARYFAGKGRGDLAFEFLRQVELRHEKTFDRAAWLLTARLWEAIDAVPEAFRARLGAAKGARPEEKLDDLAALTRLALRAGGRPLPWGTYNDESYRWAARVDVTPGFATGGLSFLLTGFERDAALTELESRRLPDRTFQTARLLLAELEKRSPKHPSLPELNVAVMQRHTERGEGEDALKLLPKTEAGSDTVKADARRVALLAMRQTKAPIEKELALWKERLRLLAPDGTAPDMQKATSSYDPDAASRRSLKPVSPGESYGSVLMEAVSRLDSRDRKHTTSLTLLLGELDRLPKAPALWLHAANQIEGWKLDEGLEQRYKQALETFGDAGWWNRLARWYARKQRGSELKALTDDVVARFRGTELFSRDPGTNGTVAVEGQPNPFVYAGQYLRLKALERFPASPMVLREAEKQLYSRSSFQALASDTRAKLPRQAIAEDELWAARRAGVLYADAARRSSFLDDLVKERKLEPLLLTLERIADRTPVESRLLLDGWSRLSQYERATPFGDRLAEQYPGDGGIASEVMTLHRSLSGLDPKHAPAVDRIARAVAPALEDASTVWTQLGETWEDLDRPAKSGEAWNRILDASPRDPAKVLEVSTIFWDYGRMKEALDVLEAGRKRIARPRLHAFEAGVLREEVKDLPGALDEYLAAMRGENDWSHGEWYGGEYRAQNRLAKLLGRKRTQNLILAKVEELKPGVAADEEALIPLLQLLGIAPEEENGSDWEEMPRDPVGREAKAEQRANARPSQRQGIARVGERLADKAMEMIPKATRVELLNAIRNRKYQILDQRWSAPQRDVELEAALLQRDAALQPTEERRIEKEIARADYLVSKGRLDDAKALWKGLRARVDALPEGATKIRDLISNARFAEASNTDAVAVWTGIGDKYPWSLGVLEDRLEFLFRTKRTADGLALLEKTAGSAAAGHRERLTERLAKESLDRGDLARGKKALSQLLTFKIDERRRILTAGLLTRVSYQSDDKAFDPMALGKAEGQKLTEDERADLWAEIAQSAQAEGKLAPALDLYIESLNRRMDRGRLSDACRLAVRAGKEAHLLKFFDAQRKRSPRDVRWAVAVREIKTFSGDLDGAIAASKEAVLVAPERESLYRETVQLLERAGRFAEAGDFLAAWAKPRPSDEAVAEWRASLYVKAGDDAKALSTERDAITAYRKDQTEKSADEVATEAGNRTARAARRFLGLGRPEVAWTLASPASGFADVPLSHAERTEIALRSGNYAKLFKAFADDADFRNESSHAVSRVARHDQLDELQNELLARLFPATAPRGDTAALNRYWDFAQAAGLERLGYAVARRIFSSEGKPWGANPPVAFLAGVTPVERNAKGTWVFSTSDLTGMWASYLAERDRLLLLEPLLSPIVASVDAAVAGGPSSIAPAWFPTDAFSRMARQPGHEAWLGSVKSWFANPTAWGRFRQTTKDKWEIRPLVALLDDDTRSAWLAFTSLPKTPEDPVMAERRAVVTRVTASLASLVEGKSNAVTDGDIARLRGPRTVGDVLGKDSAFTWPAFKPRPVDKGDDAVFGSGVDEGRIPGRLWGARPGDAWFVLEALARWREKAADAPTVPLESPSRGAEAQRTLLAVRTAEGLGNLPLALELDERYFADLANRDRLMRRLRLLAKNGRKDTANELLRNEIRSRQKKADSDTYLGWKRVAEEFGFLPPIDQLDPATPVSPALLAYLIDEAGAEKTASLKPTDLTDFRMALASRWYAMGERLGKEKTERFLDELWANGISSFPSASLKKVGPWWDRSKEFLTGVDVSLRRDALAAVRALPEPAALRAFAEKNADRREATELLLVRAELASQDEAGPLARLERMIAGTIAQAAPPRVMEPTAPPPSEEEGSEASEEAPPAEEASAASNITDLARLTKWLRAFRDSKRPTAIAAAEEKLGARLKKDFDGGRVGIETWSLAIALATSEAAHAQLLTDLERSWVRGDWALESDRLGIVSLLIPFDKPAAQRWYGRLDAPLSFAAVDARARLQVRLKDVPAVQKLWVAARARLGLTRGEELQAFDAWRRQVPAGPVPTDAPASWRAAIEFWRKKGSDFDTWGDSLAQHLAKHPYDRLAARNVLRSLSPAREAVVEPAVAALESREDVANFRILRSEVSRSVLAAKHYAQAADARDLRRRRFPRVEIDGLLTDLARVGARTGDGPMLERALLQLEERKAPNVAALRKELGVEKAKSAARPDVVQAAGSTFTALLPRDLTWDLYARVLSSEEVP